MNRVLPQPEPPGDFYPLEDPAYADPNDPQRPNRLCICFSDVHFTDGTVGEQSVNITTWVDVFERIADLCVDQAIAELTLVLVGDVVDMIRTAQWAKSGVYPWQRDHPEFKTNIDRILRGIIEKHAAAPSDTGAGGFFYHLQQLPDKVRRHHFKGKSGGDIHIRTLVLLGNHDKEIFADDAALARFYQECLGQPVTGLSDSYRQWLGRMYFGDANHYLDPARGSVPWLPFYWGDRGFRLFVTHGQWRDKDNCRFIERRGDQPGWQVKDDWQPDIWQAQRYAPFTEACFGDTVAAGLLSGFIYEAKRQLAAMDTQVLAATEQGEVGRLKRILDELDLYRPTAAAIQRVIKESWRLRGKGAGLMTVRAMLERQLMVSVRAWLSWKFTYQSAPMSRRVLLYVGRFLVWLLQVFGARIALRLVYTLMYFLAMLQRWQRSAPSRGEMKAFPGFLEAYRSYGFRIHAEGHTHEALQEEMDFATPEERKNYSYINFGTWRDQIVQKQKRGYRRRGLGRMLVILDKLPLAPGGERWFSYRVEDILTWGDNQDRLD
jgi:hypothetical protein